MGPMSEARFAYIGIKDCGCTVAVTVDTPEDKTSVAQDVSDFVKCGYTVQRVSVDEARARLQCCIHQESP